MYCDNLCPIIVKNYCFKFTSFTVNNIKILVGFCKQSQF